MLKLHTDGVEEQAGASRPTLDELAREGARRMLVAALEAEVAECIERHRSERDAQGRALVVRSGRAEPRQLTTGASTMVVQAPRVNDRRAGERFTSEILPPYTDDAMNPAATDLPQL